MYAHLVWAASVLTGHLPSRERECVKERGGGLRILEAYDVCTWDLLLLVHVRSGRGREGGREEGRESRDVHVDFDRQSTHKLRSS